MRCSKCKNLAGNASIGQCSQSGCGNYTGSSADKFCQACARKQNCCERCGKKIK